MTNLKKCMFFLFFIILTSCPYLISGEYERTITSARVESCQGCSLNRLPQVKQFVFNDIPLYENVEFKAIQGAPPELVMLSKVGEEIHRLPLSRLTRLECNELLETYGFHKKGEDTSEQENSDKHEF